MLRTIIATFIGYILAMFILKGAEIIINRVKSAPKKNDSVSTDKR